MTRVLGIETSCDETSIAILDGSGDDVTLRSLVILSQDVHRVFGGVVPELASRAHLTAIEPVLRRALSEAGAELSSVDVIAATVGPGLVGALLVGVSFGKSLAAALERPMVGVHHMEGHLFAPSLENADAQPPFVALLVSGGHTLLMHVPEWGEYHLIGQTRDDAAGEAFDKVAKLLGLPYPGGPHIERLAASGSPTRHRLPRPMLSRNQMPSDDQYYDFSFSGLKTAVVELVRSLEADGTLEQERANVAAAFQAAAVDVLATKTLRAVEQTGCSRVLLGGGVSANRSLRTEIAARLEGRGQVFFSSPRLALDNGAMVARAARFRFDRGEVASQEESASASLPFPGLRDPVESGPGTMPLSPR